MRRSALSTARRSRSACPKQSAIVEVEQRKSSPPMTLADQLCTHLGTKGLSDDGLASLSKNRADYEVSPAILKISAGKPAPGPRKWLFMTPRA